MRLGNIKDAWWNRQALPHMHVHCKENVPKTTENVFTAEG
jgi:hypothetical protein